MKQIKRADSLMLLLASFPQKFRASNDQESRRDCRKDKKNFSLTFCTGKRSHDPNYPHDDKIKSITFHVVLHCFLGCAML